MSDNGYNPEIDVDRDIIKVTVIDYDVYGHDFLLRRRKKKKKSSYEIAKKASDKWMGWKK